MSQLVVASFQHLIFSHLGVNMPHGTLYESSRVRRNRHESALKAYCQAVMSMSEPDMPALCLIPVNNQCLDVLI
jgi:hypothetical protein